MLFPFGPHRLYPSFVASVSLLLISMLVPKAGGAKGPALRLPMLVPNLKGRKKS